MLLFLISFVAGVLTVLAPCVLPLLPVIVGGSLAQGDRWRTYTICVSLGVSVIVFTLLLKASTVFINIPQTFWEWFSGIILILFGLVMVFPQLWDRLGFVNAMNRSSNKLLGAGYRRNSRVGDMLMGAALGPVFSSCSPTYFVILATVLPQSFAAGFADLLAYAVGLSGFLFVIAIVGQKLVDKLGVTINPQGWFRRVIGVLFILVGLFVATGADASTEAWLLNRGLDLGGVEEYLLGARNVSPNVTSTTSAALLTPSEEAKVYQKAPELAKVDGYINTPNGAPIRIAGYTAQHDVVLVDFWTYSCINCQRSIPYVEAWYKKYASYGFVVIGVSTPEFAFEHVYSNVANAVKQLGITYPVVLDNEYGTWNAFGSEYWPNDYLINADGYVVYNYAGEGDYNGTEAQIQHALIDRAERLGLPVPDFNATSTTPDNTIPIDFSAVNSPETYFGTNRNEYLGNGSQGWQGVQNLTLPVGNSLEPNTLYLGGSWDFEPEYAQNEAAGAQIEYEFDAKNMYIVAASATGKPVTLKLTLDGQPIPTSMRGPDVNAGSEMVIQADRLYQIVAGQNYGTHVLQITIEGPGLQGYTFTFG
ncbi:MAG TPA: cytochrome c biogenesis protein CcdA [Candidatus Paceibacterota bacterium]|jgi:cytochrome c biogenesis protein CcdA/thiol-disulfide isomerase/thioredoxin|nr:cytochrome c biogenesis protein CcdA [Candidatus Paceibacterota bacterium]